MASPCRNCSGGGVVGSYQSVFCGLGCQLSQDYSPLARFLVNRDSTFLSVVGLGLSEATPTASMRTCCNPLAKSKPIVQNEPVLAYSAAVTVCGLATKLEDDVDDERGLRRQASRIFGRGLSSATDKAVAQLNNFGFPTKEVKDLLASQTSIEKSNPDLYEAAAPTSQAYGTIFAHLGSFIDSSTPSLKALGENLGRLIYWRDAFDDEVKDEKAGKFNLLRYTSWDELALAAQSSMEVLTQTQASLALPHYGDLFSQITATTVSKHQGFLCLAASGGGKEKEQQKKKRWWDDCCGGCDCSPCCCDCPGDCGVKDAGGGSDCGSGCCECDCCCCGN